jgi:hypothetical protein
MLNMKKEFVFLVTRFSSGATMDKYFHEEKIMKTRLISLILLLLLLVIQTLPVTGASRPSIYAQTGLSMPASPEDFNSTWRSGYNLGIGLSKRLSSRVEMQSMFEYHNFSLNDMGYLDSVGLTDAAASVSDGTISIMTLFAHIKLLYPPKNSDKVLPYLIGGAGLFHKKSEEINYSNGESFFRIPGKSESALGVDGGLGFDILAGATTFLTVEIKIVFGFTGNENTIFIPLKVGVKID